MEVREHAEVALGAMVNMRRQDHEKLGPRRPVEQKLGNELSKACLSRTPCRVVHDLDREKIPLCLYQSLNEM